MRKFMIVLVLCSGLAVLGALPPEEDVAGSYLVIYNLMTCGDTIGGPNDPAFRSGKFVNVPYDSSNPEHRKLTLTTESRFSDGVVVSLTSSIDEYLAWWSIDTRGYTNIKGKYYLYDDGAVMIDVRFYGGPIRTLEIMIGEDIDTIEYLIVNGEEDPRFESFWDLAVYM